MEISPTADERNDIFAEEMVKHVLLKDFGIHWEPDFDKHNSPRLALSEFYTSCVLLGEAVFHAWKKFHAAIEQESNLIYKSLDISANTEKIYSSLTEVAKKLNLQSDYVFFIVMAIFGDLCVRICRSGAESLISDAVSAAKKYIVEEGLACKRDLQINSVNFMEFCETDDDYDKF